MSYYHGLISSKRANSILNERGNRTFLIRDSQSQPGCFVLSAKSGGKVYHVLIFHKGGEYSLDVAGEGGAPAVFSSLDDLVVFCMSHKMRMEGDEVSLKEVIHCGDEPLANEDFPVMETNGSKEVEDTDQLTDLFLSLFGRQCSVVSVGHSSLNFAGQPLPSGEERLVILARDRPQKAFFIKVVDPQERKVIAEKRVNKNFQYDTPGELVITYLSEHGITCIGFRDKEEKERFCHQLKRAVCWLGERAQKQKEKVMEAGERQRRGRDETDSPEHQFVRTMKAEDFDIDHLAPEWQYLFDMAGVTRPMLEDPVTLQFILDTVLKIGGAPHDLETVQEEALDPDSMSKEGGGSVRCGGAEMKRERMKVLAVDHALRREMQRASRLAEELQKVSIARDNPLPLLSPGCVYKSQCESFKDHLMVRHTLVAIGPEKGSCYCQGLRGRETHRPGGRLSSSAVLPPSRMVPLRPQVPDPCSGPAVPVAVARGLLCGADHQSGWSDEDSYEDDLSGQHFKVRTAFQVYIQPGSYSVDAVSEQSNSPSQSQLAWTAQGQTYVVHALLVQMIPVTPHTK
ncbi:Tyrosine-protein phosphatase corkscrew (Fragment) [Geodia barretti]|uniref:Tyrosine-protein phosphatase corkscrew n=1 Tax=Geodia barretti TaxID=519541 RepID=A0AA35SUE8_GEOBA